MSKTTPHDLLVTLTTALEERFATACELTVQAQEALRNHEDSQAVGALLPLEQLIPETHALMQTLLTVWRSRLTTEVRS